MHERRGGRRRHRRRRARPRRRGQRERPAVGRPRRWAGLLRRRDRVPPPPPAQARRDRQRDLPLPGRAARGGVPLGPRDRPEDSAGDGADAPPPPRRERRGRDRRDRPRAPRQRGRGPRGACAARRLPCGRPREDGRALHGGRARRPVRGGPHDLSRRASLCGGQHVDGRLPRGAPPRAAADRRDDARRPLPHAVDELGSRRGSRARAAGHGIQPGGRHLPRPLRRLGGPRRGRRERRLGDGADAGDGAARQRNPARRREPRSAAGGVRQRGAPRPPRRPPHGPRPGGTLPRVDGSPLRGGGR